MVESYKSRRRATNMRRTFFLIAMVAVVLTLSSCGDIIGAILVGKPFKFHNRSSYTVNVYVDLRTFPDKTFTLQPGESNDVYDRGVDELDYTYTPSDLVETGCTYYEYTITGYEFWNR
jgi:hypothetical protein